MIEALIGLAGTVFGFLMALILGQKLKKRDNDDTKKTSYKNADFEALQGAIDDLRGNPVAVDDKIREWLRK